MNINKVPFSYYGLGWFPKSVFSKEKNIWVDYNNEALHMFVECAIVTITCPFM